MPRITETQLTIPTLTALAATHGGFLSTSDIIAHLDETVPVPAQVRDKDHKLRKNRDNVICHKRADTYFTQKVRNMISHRHSKGSFIARGFAEYVVGVDGIGGLRITPKGRALLRKPSESVAATVVRRGVHPV